MTKIVLTMLLAALATVAQAVKLTNSDWNVVAGEAFTITWTDAQGVVSIRLKSGPANSLKTVQEITSGQSGESFTWTVPSNLDAAQYAIEIEDGSGNINYSVQFPISGATASQTIGSAGEFATATAAVTTPSTRAVVSPTSTPTSETKVADTITSSASETVSETEVAGSRTASDSTRRETHTALTLTTTRTNRPSATGTDVAESGVPNAGTASRSGRALMGAVVGALLLVY